MLMKIRVGVGLGVFESVVKSDGLFGQVVINYM